MRHSRIPSLHLTLPRSYFSLLLESISHAPLSLTLPPTPCSRPIPCIPSTHALSLTSPNIAIPNPNWHACYTLLGHASKGHIWQSPQHAQSWDPFEDFNQCPSVDLPIHACGCCPSIRATFTLLHNLLIDGACICIRSS